LPSIFSEEVELKEDLQKADDTYFNNLFNLRDAEKKTTEENKELQLAAYSQLAGALQSLAGESKELAIAQAIIDTYLGANKALASAPPPVNFITAAAVIASGLANVKNIMKQDVGGGSGGSVPTPTVAAPRTEIQSGAFTLEGGVEPEPARAFVVSDDITDSQNKLANIRRRATI